MLRANYSRSKTTMRREWGVVRTRNVNQLDEIRENKECRAYALAYDRDDYIFDCAMKNPTRNHQNIQNNVNFLISTPIINKLHNKTQINVVN